MIVSYGQHLGGLEVKRAYYHDRQVTFTVRIYFEELHYSSQLLYISLRRTKVTQNYPKEPSLYIPLMYKVDMTKRSLQPHMRLTTMGSATISVVLNSVRKCETTLQLTKVR